MDFKDERTESNLYTKQPTWTNEEIFAIRPENVVAYMKLKAYGDVDADPETQQPTKCRWETLNAIKKGISFFHPEKDRDWSIRSLKGNPVWSVVVQNLVNKVNLAEIAGLGAPSQERGPFVEEEFEQAIRILESIDDMEERLFLAAIFKLQYNMGCRIDDACKEMLSNIKPNRNSTHALLLIIQNFLGARTLAVKSKHRGKF